MRIAESMSKKEVTIRRRDFRGAQVWMGACWFMSSRIWIRFEGRKMSGSWRFWCTVSLIYFSGVGEYIDLL